MVPVYTADMVDLGDGEQVRCHKALCLIDARDVFGKVSNNPRSCERLVWAYFKTTDPGVRKAKWTNESGTGRIIVRADILAAKLKTFRNGKCDKAITLADSISNLFSNASLIGDNSPTASFVIEEVDTSIVASRAPIVTAIPSKEKIQESVSNEIARAVIAAAPQGALESLAKRKLDAESELVDYHVKCAKIVMKINHARELNDKEMEAELKQRLMDA